MDYYAPHIQKRIKRNLMIIAGVLGVVVIGLAVAAVLLRVRGGGEQQPKEAPRPLTKEEKQRNQELTDLEKARARLRQWQATYASGTQTEASSTKTPEEQLRDIDAARADQPPSAPRVPLTQEEAEKQLNELNALRGQ